MYTFKEGITMGSVVVVADGREGVVRIYKVRFGVAKDLLETLPILTPSVEINRRINELGHYWPIFEEERGCQHEHDPVTGNCVHCGAFRY